MPAKPVDTISERLLVIESFVQDPPDSEFSRGYLCALMEEAVEDMAEAGSDIFAKALELFKADEILYRNWKIRRAKTVG